MLASTVVNPAIREYCSNFIGSICCEFLVDDRFYNKSTTDLQPMEFEHISFTERLPVLPINLDFDISECIHVLRARASLFRRFTHTNVYVTGSDKIRKTRHKTSVDTHIFFTAYMHACMH